MSSSARQLLCLASAVVALCVSDAQAQSQRPPAIDASRLPAELVSLTAEEVARIARMAPVAAFPSDPTNRFADDERAAELGHRLFFDTRISPKGVSCATCHDPAKHFTDGLPLARGIGVTTRNAPTVVDSGRRRWVGWDGKFDSLWSQALAPIENPVEMGSSRERLQQVVRDDAALRALDEAHGARRVGGRAEHFQLVSHPLQRHHRKLPGPSTADPVSVVHSSPPPRASARSGGRITPIAELRPKPLPTDPS